IDDNGRDLAAETMPDREDEIPVAESCWNTDRCCEPVHTRAPHVPENGGVISLYPLEKERRCTDFTSCQVHNGRHFFDRVDFRGNPLEFAGTFDTLQIIAEIGWTDSLIKFTEIYVPWDRLTKHGRNGHISLIHEV